MKTEVRATDEETVERKETQYTRDPEKIYKGELIKIIEALQGIPQKNPLAYEVSRAIKVVEKEVNSFVKERSDMMSKYLLRNEDGNWEVTKQSQMTIDAGRAQGIDLIPTEFGYEIEGGEDSEFEYKEKMNKLLNSEVKLGLKPIYAGKKTVKVGENRLPLLDVISDYFEINQINLLEKIGVLTGL